MRILTDALVEPPSFVWDRWKPSDRMFGRIDGDSFWFRLETSVFGGRSPSFTNGEIRVRQDGEAGTDVAVRVSDWPVFVIPVILGGVGIALWTAAATGRQVWQAVGIGAAAWIVAAVLYLLEVRRVQKIFERLLLPPTSDYV